MRDVDGFLRYIWFERFFDVSLGGMKKGYYNVMMRIFSKLRFK